MCDQAFSDDDHAAVQRHPDDPALEEYGLDQEAWALQEATALDIPPTPPLRSPRAQAAPNSFKGGLMPPIHETDPTTDPAAPSDPDSTTGEAGNGENNAD